MKNCILKFFYLFLTLLPQLSIAEDLPMDQLYKFGDGLNIEGGDLCCKYLNEKQIFANICVILDRPFYDGIEWQALTNTNRFALKEASILDYNEAQVNFGYATLMYYYIANAHKLAGKQSNQPVKILMQVHRNTSGPRHVALLESLLLECYPHLKGIKTFSLLSKYELFTYSFPEINVEVHFCFGVNPDNLGKIGKYDDTDIILSFSLIAGFHPQWGAGSLVVPDHFIPFPLITVNADVGNSYRIMNHIKEIISPLISSQDQFVLDVVNKNFLSMNFEKQRLKARFFDSEDFKEATIFQADDLFNPSKLPKTFSVSL